MNQSDFQSFLDDVSECFIERDFALWRSRVLYPFSLITSAGAIVIENDDELRDNFELYLQACDAMQLDRIYRVPLGLEACSDGTWLGSYETNLLRNGMRATAPYRSTALLHKNADGIRMSSIMNARGHHDWTGKQPNMDD
ncbi:hypothetical protein CEP88_16500 [Roseobacter denitrificans]|uniref:Uncharacterized protein n=1 Tax=Roseobacter denitrificans (strain ATCC 33942 / OCh 114) TaxID=375451 RepID=Q16AP2_ROSDO|nr:hypothetical protein [Roseobacter denitrificans]ABG30951.1 hypothetical protein RD1_1306 [Roseobacter denitrificans OCh 114]AVL54039.1 hypothetical protein CEP88_16500 [Roseobacter denitrificans]SFG13630.1 hypothetical protein SAMN05443635_10886 [Roseobacter denitrificans OCh 114]